MTFEVCDRCGREIVGQKCKLNIELGQTYHHLFESEINAFRSKELCKDCAKKVRFILDNMLEELMTVQEDEEDE